MEIDEERRVKEEGCIIFVIGLVRDDENIFINEMGKVPLSTALYTITIRYL